MLKFVVLMLQTVENFQRCKYSIKTYYIVIHSNATDLHLLAEGHVTEEVQI